MVYYYFFLTLNLQSDLGLARNVDSKFGPSAAPILTEYVISRYYRAPEVMLSSNAVIKWVTNFYIVK